MKAKVLVYLRPSILDPQGQAISKTLKGMGFPDVDVRQGKIFMLEFDKCEGSPRDYVERMCKELLINPVMEDYYIEEMTTSIVSKIKRFISKIGNKRN